MADENLSLSITFENAQALIADIERVKDSIRSLSSLASSTGLQSLDADVSNLSSSLQQLDQPVEIDINADVIDDIQTSATDAVGSIQEIESESGAAVASLDELGSAEVDPNVNTDGLDRLEDASRKAKNELNLTGKEGEKAGKRIEKANRKAAESTKKATTNITKMKTAFKALGAAAIGLTAFRSIDTLFRRIANQAKLSATIFAGTERAVLRFASGLQAVGDFSEASIKDIQDYGDKIQSLTGISDDLVVHASALIAQLGALSGKGLRRATNASIELATVLQTDLKTAALLVAKAAQGNTTQFQRYGIVVNNAIPPSQKFAAILDLIERKFRGTAQLSAEGLGGAVTKLTKEWDDFLKAVGSSLRVFEPTLAKMTAILQRFNRGLDNHIDDAVLASDKLKVISREIDNIANKNFEGLLARLLTALGTAPLTTIGVPLSLVPDFRVDTDTIISNEIKRIQARLPSLDLSVNLVLGGKPEGVVELVNQIDAVRRQLKELRKNPKVSIEVNPKAFNEISQLDAELTLLQNRAREGISIAIEAQTQKRITELERLQQLANPTNPIQLFIESDTTDLEAQQRRIIKNFQEAEAEAKALGEFPKEFARIKDQDVEIDVKTNLLPPPLINVDAFIKANLDPREIQAGLDLEADIKVSPELDQDKFLVLIGQVSKLFAAAQQAAAENQNKQTLALLFQAQRLNQILVQASKVKLAEIQFNVAPEADQAQQFMDDLVAKSIQAKAETESLGDALAALANIRGASLAEKLDIQALRNSGDAVDQLAAGIKKELRTISTEAANIKTPEEAADLLDQLSPAALDAAAALVALHGEFGEAGDAAREALGDIPESILTMLPALKKAAAATDQFTEQQRELAKIVGNSILQSFDAAFDAVVLSSKSFADDLKQIFADLVKDIIKELIKVKVFDFALGLFSGRATATASAINQIPIPVTKAGQQPLAPVIPIPEIPTIKVEATGTLGRVDLSPITEFARLRRAEALATIRRQEPVIVRIQEERQPQRDVKINITSPDGPGVRRLMTTGALRAETARAVRRSRL